MHEIKLEIGKITKYRKFELITKEFNGTLLK